MQIGKILCPITTLGPGKRIGIWLQGCTRFCKGCSNPELQIFDKTKEIDVNDFFGAIKDLKYEGVTISGGEPFLQAGELKKIVEFFYQKGVHDILIYTGFTKEELEKKNNIDINYILTHIAVLIDGPFIEELVDDIPLRGSSNQRVLLFNDKFESIYTEYLKKEKEVNIFSFSQDTHFIGIPFKHYDKTYKNFLRSKKGNE